jgi:hypothetical protein
MTVAFAVGAVGFALGGDRPSTVEALNYTDVICLDDRRSQRTG